MRVNPTSPKTSKTTRASIPQAEMDRRMKDGECMKCGKKGHIQYLAESLGEISKTQLKWPKVTLL